MSFSFFPFFFCVGGWGIAMEEREAELAYQEECWNLFFLGRGEVSIFPPSLLSSFTKNSDGVNEWQKMNAGYFLQMIFKCGE